MGTERYEKYILLFGMPNDGYPYHRAEVYSLQGASCGECWLLCLNPRCAGCLSYAEHASSEYASPETFIFHVDCLNLFSKFIITHTWMSWKKLWQIGRATSPWFPLALNEIEGKSSRSSVFKWIETLDKESSVQQLVRHLVEIPEEIYDMIWLQTTENSILNRFAMVFTWSKDLLDIVEIQANIQKPYFSFLGRDYVLRHQLQSLCLASCSSFRLGVDHIGIQTFEDLGKASTSAPRLKSPWYIVQHYKPSNEVFSSVSW